MKKYKIIEHRTKHLFHAIFVARRKHSIVAEKNRLRTITASWKISCKFSQASHWPEKNAACGYSANGTAASICHHTSTA